MTNNEVIQRIQSLYSRGVQSDDSRLSSRHIFSKAITVRSKLLNQKINKKQKIGQWNYQTLNCVELIEAESHECPCLPPIGCTISKVKYPFPKIISSSISHQIQSITSVDGSITFSETDWSAKKYKSGNKYTANKPDYFIRNGSIYITHKVGMKVIAVTFLAENPIEAYLFQSLCSECNEITGSLSIGGDTIEKPAPDPSTGGISYFDNSGKSTEERPAPVNGSTQDIQIITDCIDCKAYYDYEFPLDNEMIENLILISSEELIRNFGSNVEDLKNNAIDKQ